MMLQRELCELKIKELCEEHDKLVDDFETGKCYVEYFIRNSLKISGEIRGICYVLGLDVEKKMGRE